MIYKSIKTVASELKDLFNIEMDLYLVVKNTVRALNDIGALRTTRGVLIRTVKDYCVQIPTGVIGIQSIVEMENPNVQEIILQQIEHPSTVFFTNEDKELDVETHDLKDNYVDMPKGPYPDYVIDYPMIKFNKDGLIVAIEYSGIPLDNEGFPKVPEECIEACAYYCALIYYRPMFMLGEIDGGRMSAMEQWTRDRMDSASAKFKLGKLDKKAMNEILNVVASFDRKAYGTDI